MNLRKKIFLFVLVLLLLCISVSTILIAGAEQEQKFKTVRVALTNAPITFDPANHRHRNSQTIIRNWTDGLTQTLPDGSHVLDLAESITQFDSLTYEIKIKKGVTFHNGDPMTADDVVFSITRLAIDGGMEGETSPRKAIVAPTIESVEKKDDFTVIVKLENSYDMGRRWYNIEIMPKKYLEEVGIERFLEHPIGVGPFKWVEGDLSTQVVLERYEDYYGGLAELPGEVSRVPALDRVIFLPVPEANTRVAALMAGDVDIITNVPFDSIALLENNPGVKVVSQEGTSPRVMYFNTSKSPFDDKRVRQAIAYAIDYDLIVEQLLLGHSDALKGIPFLDPYFGEPGHGAFNDIKSPYDYDPGKAKTLLTEAGVSNLSLVIDAIDENNEVAQAIAQMLQDVGINASVRVWDYGVLSEEFPKGQRDILLHQFGNAAKIPNWVDGVAGTGQPNNYALYSNSTFDGLIKKAISMEDSPERNKLFVEAYEIILEEVPAITIHNPRVVEACRANVLNFVPHNGGRLNLHRVDIE